MKKMILILLLTTIIGMAVCVKADPFPFSVYDQGIEWVVLNFTDVNTTEFIPIDNVTLAYVNSSDYWDNLDTPSDLQGLIVVPASNISGEYWVDETGDTMTGDLNMSGNRITDVGQMIMAGLISAGDIIPGTDSLFDLGNSSNKWQEAYINNIYSTNVYASFLNVTDINSTNINSIDIFSTRVNSTNVSSQLVDSTNVNVKKNITMGGNTIQLLNQDLVMVLGDS